MARPKPPKKPPPGLGKAGKTITDAYGRILRADELDAEGRPRTRTTPTPGSQFGGFGLPAGPGYGTLQGARDEQYLGLSYMPSGWEIDDIIDLQSQLDEAGFYSGDYVLGVWDQTTARAYEQALRLADARGQPVQATLLQARMDKEKQAARTRAPLTIKLTSRDDIKALSNNVARDLYGGDLDDATVDAIAAGIHAQERDYQTSAYNFEETGGEIVAPTDPSVAAETEIKKRFPNEVAATAFGAAFDDIINTFGRSVV